jgi:hypothetical protein
MSAGIDEAVSFHVNDRPARIRSPIASISPGLITRSLARIVDSGRPSTATSGFENITKTSPGTSGSRLTAPAAATPGTLRSRSRSVSSASTVRAGV